MAVGLLLSSMVACTGNKTSDATCCNGEGGCTEQCKCDKNSNCKTNKEMTYSKKYTNADFYKDGKFDQEVALKAMKDMFEFYGVPFTDLMAKDIWVTDFGLGDFENVGMGGIFWINDAEHGYFAHAIYLLPGQMIPEHAHVKLNSRLNMNHGWLKRDGFTTSQKLVMKLLTLLLFLPATDRLRARISLFRR